MASIASDPADVIVGVDPHKDQHVAVALDGLGRRLGERFVSAALPAAPTCSPGRPGWVGWRRSGWKAAAPTGSGWPGSCAAMGSWCWRSPARPARASGACRQERPGRRRARRPSSARRERTCDAQDRRGAVEAIRLLRVARDAAVTAHSQAMITLKATLVTANGNLRAELEPRTDFTLVTACAALEVAGDLTDPEVAMRHALRALARRWLELHEEVKAHTRHLKRLTSQAAPALVATFGIGFDCAAELLCAAGDNAGRVRSEAAYAKLCGACPIPASSGKRTRHRLNRGGNRQANAALFRIVVVRMRRHPPTIAYLQRRTAEGLSKREVIRCLKRYVAREVYRLLPVPTATPAEPPQAA